LLSQGYKLLARNFHARNGEIDIIAEDKDILCFIEVKYYQENSLRDLHQAVDQKKQQKIIKAAQAFLFAKKIEKRYIRFDVVLISCDAKSKVKSLELHKDAFRPE